jgi:hypothetical protein
MPLNGSHHKQDILLPPFPLNGKNRLVTLERGAVQQENNGEQAGEIEFRRRKMARKRMRPLLNTQGIRFFSRGAWKQPPLRDTYAGGREAPHRRLCSGGVGTETTGTTRVRLKCQRTRGEKLKC